MDDELAELRERIVRLEERLDANRSGRWWNVAGGIASILGAALAGLTLWAVLTPLSQFVP